MLKITLYDVDGIKIESRIADSVYTAAAAASKMIMSCGGLYNGDRLEVVEDPSND